MTGRLMPPPHEKQVLDVTCGSRMIWFNKKNPIALYTDVREMEATAIWKSTKNDSVRYCEVKPDIVADFTDLPFEDNSFYCVVFDPPHLERLGDESWMCKKYEKLRPGWQQKLHDGFRECMRVLKPHGILIFKWSEADFKVSEILKIIDAKPLFGNRSGKHMNTIWMTFIKEE